MNPYHSPRPARHAVALVARIQLLARDVSGYTTDQLRGRPKSHKGQAIRRRRAAELVREWRRAKMASPDSQGSEKPSADVA